MRRLFLLLALLVGTQALAGDTLIGTITSTGTDVSNGTTAVAFVVPQAVKLSVQCDAPAYFITDSKTAVSSTNGIKLATDQFFQTSSGKVVVITVSSTVSAVIRVISVSGTVNCKVFTPKGDE